MVTGKNRFHSSGIEQHRLGERVRSHAIAGNDRSTRFTKKGRTFFRMEDMGCLTAFVLLARKIRRRGSKRSFAELPDEKKPARGSWIANINRLGCRTERAQVPAGVHDARFGAGFPERFSGLVDREALRYPIQGDLQRAARPHRAMVQELQMPIIAPSVSTGFGEARQEGGVLKQRCNARIE